MGVLKFNKMLCPKCKQPVIAPDGKDFIICCDEVIYVISETHDRETEREADDCN